MFKTRIRLGLGDRHKARPFYTVLILPHAKSRFRKLHLSRAFVWSLAGLALLTLVAGLVSPHLLFKIHGQRAALERLSAENQQLREQHVATGATLEEMGERLSGFENATGRLAEALGVEDLPSDEPAAGGPGLPGPRGPRRSWLNDEFEALDARTLRLDASLDQLDEAFRKRMRVLASTPNGMPIEGWFSHGYGWRKDPFNGQRQFHRGIDIVADKGTPIHAPADGVVTRAARLSDYGKTLDISHGSGYVTRYGHMSEILARPGQRVRRGDVVGRVGSTGRSTGPHLHYEVFRDGRRVNPWKYLDQKGR